jgi:hypothetical protein
MKLRSFLAASMATSSLMRRVRRGRFAPRSSATGRPRAQNRNVGRMSLCEKLVLLNWFQAWWRGWAIFRTFFRGKFRKKICPKSRGKLEFSAEKVSKNCFPKKFRGKFRAKWFFRGKKCTKNRPQIGRFFAYWVTVYFERSFGLFPR